MAILSQLSLAISCSFLNQRYYEKVKERCCTWKVLCCLYPKKCKPAKRMVQWCLWSWELSCEQWSVAQERWGHAQDLSPGPPAGTSKPAQHRADKYCPPPPWFWNSYTGAHLHQREWSPWTQRDCLSSQTFGRCSRMNVFHQGPGLWQVCSPQAACHTLPMRQWMKILPEE